MMMGVLTKGVLRELVRIPPSSIATRCRIRASNDIEAMERWLDEYFDKPTTYRSYKKEAERFLVWCVMVRKLTLSELCREDVQAYVDFLADPQPRNLWCGPRRKKHDGEEHQWYPFAGPLRAPAIKTALAILTSFLNFLLEAQYLEANPFTLVRRKSRFKKNFDEHAMNVEERILSADEWQAFLDALSEMDESSPDAKQKKQRAVFIVTALYFLGLRIEELALARWHNCKKINDKWWFFVRGKNDRLGKIPINTELLHAIMTYRNAQGKTPLPVSDDDGPLIVKLSENKTALTSRQLSNVIKTLATQAAQKFPKDSIAHNKLLRLSPHWLRHLSASRQDLAGISVTNIKSNLRHQNEQTTRIYIHAYDEERHREMEKLRF